jgi:hypothetical protein
MYFSLATITLILSLISIVSAHGAIVGAMGDAGGNGWALGIDPSTPRTGSTPNPFERDTSVLPKGANTAPGCGSTPGGGANNIQTGTSKILAQAGGTLPQVSSGGSLNMVLHQVTGVSFLPSLTFSSLCMLQCKLQTPANAPITGRCRSL